MADTNHHSDIDPMMAHDERADKQKMSEIPMSSNPVSHTLSPNDPDNPMNWSLHRRLYTSAVAWAMGFTV